MAKLKTYSNRSNNEHAAYLMLLISPRIQEEILFSGIFKLNKIPEYKLRSIINEPDWQKQQELWQKLLNS